MQMCSGIANQRAFPLLCAHAGNRCGSAGTVLSTRPQLWSAGQSWPWGQIPPAHPIFCRGYNRVEVAVNVTTASQKPNKQDIWLLFTNQRDEALVDTCRTAQNACFPLYPAPLIPNPLPCRVVSSAIEFPLSRPGCTRWLVTEHMISSHMQHLAMARSALKIAGLQSS